MQYMTTINATQSTSPHDVTTAIKEGEGGRVEYYYYC